MYAELREWYRARAIAVALVRIVVTSKFIDFHMATRKRNARMLGPIPLVESFKQISYIYTNIVL